MSEKQLSTIDNSIVVVDVQGIFRTLWRRKFTILGTGLVFACIAAYFALAQPNQYEAVSRIIVEPDETQLTGIGGTGLGRPIGEALIESNAYMVQSNRILERVVVDLGLDTNRVFLGPLDETQPQPSSPELDIRLAMKKLNSVLTVRPVGDSYIVSIAAQTESPELSAAIANSIATTFIDYEQAVEAEERQEANKWLFGRLEDLRSRVNKSSKELETFRSQAGDLSERKFNEISLVLQALRRDQASSSNPAQLAARIDELNEELREFTSQRIALNELARQAEADSVLYERLLERARELQELETFQVSNIRIVYDALPPLEKSAPRRTLIVLLGFVLGSVFSAAIITLRATP
jgi:uncharacterized protein involved in exopolysaccharide biosynthesis